MGNQSATNVLTFRSTCGSRRLAERQHGVVALRQLQLLGLSKSAVSRRAGAGRLHRIHRGVYAVGYPKLIGYGHWMAAVLACGPGRSSPTARRPAYGT